MNDITERERDYEMKLNWKYFRREMKKRWIIKVTYMGCSCPVKIQLPSLYNWPAPVRGVIRWIFWVYRPKWGNTYLESDSTRLKRWQAILCKYIMQRTKRGRLYKKISIDRGRDDLLIRLYLYEQGKYNA